MLAANKDWAINATAWVLFVCILVNASYWRPPAAQPEQWLEQLKFLMAVPHMHSSAQPADSWDTFSLCCTGSGLAACISGKGKAPSWPECRGAQQDINEKMAGMSSSPQPWVDPAWQPDMWQSPAEPPRATRDRCHPVPTSTAILPSHPDLLALYRHTSPWCLPEEHQAIWDLQPRCADTAPTILGLVLLSRTRFVLFPLWLSGCWNKTAPPSSFLSLIRVISNKYFFTVIYTFIASTSRAAPTLSEVLAEKYRRCWGQANGAGTSAEQAGNWGMEQLCAL